MHIWSDLEYHRVGIWRKKSSITLKKVYIFIPPGLTHKVGSTAFSHTMWNWREKPYIYYVMKCTLGWKSNGKKTPTHNLMSLAVFSYAIGSCHWNRFGKKSTHSMGKLWDPIFQILSIVWVLLYLPILYEIDGKIHTSYMWWSLS